MTGSRVPRKQPASQRPARGVVIRGDRCSFGCALLRDRLGFGLRLRTVAQPGQDRTDDRRGEQAIDQTTLVGVNELTAIGRGGQALAGLADQQRATPLMVVSAGSGTAVVRAEGDSYAHVSGTAVGGGTMLGLARLLLHTVDPLEIDQLAQVGDANGVDLSLADVVTGPIGTLPANATAVNFGRLARQNFTPRRQDIAAGIVTLVGQTIGLIAINAARAQQVARIVVTGHMTDMTSIRNVLQSVASFYQATIELPAEAGYATAMGALLAAAKQEEVT